MDSTIRQGDSRNSGQRAIFAGITLFAGFAVLVMTASPFVNLLGMLAIAILTIGFAVTATTFLLDSATAFLALDQKDIRRFRALDDHGISRTASAA